jgi:hypothetical protein
MKTIIYGGLVILAATFSQMSVAERLGTDGFVYMPTWIYEVTVPHPYTGKPTFMSETFNDLILRMPGTGSTCVILPYKSDVGPIFERTVKCEDGTKVVFVCDASTDETGDNEGKVCIQKVEGRFALKLVVRKHLSHKENEKRQVEFEKSNPISY